MRYNLKAKKIVAKSAPTHEKCHVYINMRGREMSSEKIFVLYYMPVKCTEKSKSFV